MSFRQKVSREIRLFAATTLYFAICFGVLVLLKRLYLAEYQVEVTGLSLALVGALVAAKVVLVMEHVSLGQWVRAHPALLEVVLRTLLYSIVAFVVMWLERGFEARHEHGGFVSGLVWVFQHRDLHHILADTIIVGGAFLGFNALSVLQRHLGEGGLRRLFLSRSSGGPGAESPLKTE
jgi:hypothetical protein